MRYFRQLLGLGGLAKHESPECQQLARYFSIVLLVVLLWLPVQWYLQSISLLSNQFLNVTHWVIWTLFVLELLSLVSCVTHKMAYLRNNWLNIFIIVTSFPVWWQYPFSWGDHGQSYVTALRYLRFIMIFRLLFPQIFNFERLLRRNRFSSTLAVFLIVTILSGTLASYIDPGIGTPWNGIWWAVETVTTVGYGDVVPTTIAGKAFATLLMISGVALLSLVTANLSALFIEHGRGRTEAFEKQLLRELRSLESRIADLQQDNVGLKQKLQDIERQLMNKQ